MSDNLKHYGVKGMKWGVRRYQPYPKGSRKKKSVEFHKESSKTIRTNRDGSKTVPKGFVFNRVGQDFLDVNVSGALYVSHGKADAARYIKNLGPTLMGKLMGQYGTTVQHLTVKSDLKIPSIDKTVEGYAKVLLENPDILNRFNNSMIYSTMATGTMDKRISIRDVENAINNPKYRESKRLAYGVSGFLANSDYGKEASKIHDYFRKEGYDGVIDLYDKYSGTSETSMIIINPTKLKMDSKTSITKDIMKAGKQHVKEVGKLKISDVVSP